MWRQGSVVPFLCRNVTTSLVVESHTVEPCALSGTCWFKHFSLPPCLVSLRGLLVQTLFASLLLTLVRYPCPLLLFLLLPDSSTIPAGQATSSQLQGCTWGPSALFSLPVFPFTHLYMFQCAGPSGMHLCWAGMSLLNYSWLSCWNYRRRRQRVLSCCHSLNHLLSDILKALFLKLALNLRLY